MEIIMIASIIALTLYVMFKALYTALFNKEERSEAIAFLVIACFTVLPFAALLIEMIKGA